MTAGGLTAIVLTLFTEVTGARPRRLHCALDVEDLPEIRDFLSAFAGRCGWDAAMSARLGAVAEESLLTMIDAPLPAGATARRALRVTASKQEGRAVLEFVAAASEENISDRLAVLDEPSAERPAERDLSLRVLAHYASSVVHQQYHEVDIVTVQVDVL